jgi:hypothetical protein
VTERAEPMELSRRVPAAFSDHNQIRRVAALELRQRIASIAASHAPRVPTAREIARALIPDITVAPPLSVRAIQWHMQQIPEVCALREKRRVLRAPASDSRRSPA